MITNHPHVAAEFPSIRTAWPSWRISLMVSNEQPQPWAKLLRWLILVDPPQHLGPWAVNLARGQHHRSQRRDLQLDSPCEAVKGPWAHPRSAAAADIADLSRCSCGFWSKHMVFASFCCWCSHCCCNCCRRCGHHCWRGAVQFLCFCPVWWCFVFLLVLSIWLLHCQFCCWFYCSFLMFLLLFLFYSFLVANITTEQITKPETTKPSLTYCKSI